MVDLMSRHSRRVGQRPLTPVRMYVPVQASNAGLGKLIETEEKTVRQRPSCHTAQEGICMGK